VPKVGLLRMMRRRRRTRRRNDKAVVRRRGEGGGNIGHMHALVWMGVCDSIETESLGMIKVNQ
jgi:hypothetical protein